VILKVRCLAALGLSDGLHGFRPSPSRFKHGTPDSRAADLDWFNTALRKLTNFVRLPETSYFCFVHEVSDSVGLFGLWLLSNRKQAAQAAQGQR
jgi:hypothetical protein